MDPGDVIVIALLLGCPLLMIFMHRGGHGAPHSHNRDRSYNAPGDFPEGPSLAELRQWHEEIVAEITRLENEELETASAHSEPIGSPAALRGARDGSR